MLKVENVLRVGMSVIALNHYRIGALLKNFFGTLTIFIWVGVDVYNKGFLDRETFKLVFVVGAFQP